MRKLIASLAFTACLWAPALSQPASDKRVLPDPLQWIEPDSVSFGVLVARPDDKGFRELLHTAWESMLKNPKGAEAWLGLMANFLSTSKQESLLLGFLPFQGARVDRFDEQGQDHSITAMTLAGWQGIQAMQWSRLQAKSDHEDFPTKMVGEQILVLRPKAGQKPEEGPAMARVKGTFMAFSDPATGERCLTSKGPSGPLYEIARKLDTTQDTYGVLLNRNGSLVKFFTWLDELDVHTIVAAVGEKRFVDDMAMVEYVSWVGDMVDGDRMDLELHFRTNGGEATADEMEKMLTDVRKALKTKARVADLQMTVLEGDVIVRVQMTGHGKLIRDFLERSK